jgi:ppGpp synthetase/RelA/SpoT-type nucleotidyltranferase
MHIFTPEHLIMYLYNDEIDEQLREQIETALQNDWSLREKLQVIRESKDRLDKAGLSQPRTSSISAILSHAGKPEKV